MALPGHPSDPFRLRFSALPCLVQVAIGARNGAIDLEKQAADKRRKQRYTQGGRRSNRCRAQRQLAAMPRAGQSVNAAFPQLVIPDRKGPSTHGHLRGQIGALKGYEAY